MFAEQPRHRERGEARNQRFALPCHVAAPLNRSNGGGVSRRTTDAFFFEPLHQRRLGITRRRHRRMRLFVEPRDNETGVELIRRVNALAGCEFGKQRFLFVELRRRVVTALDIRAQISGELDRLPARGQDGGLAIGTRARDFDVGAQHARLGHLGRDGAFPDEVVDTKGVGVEYLLER
jgi:hypothetical protein